jgi:hypothetical protein
MTLYGPTYHQGTPTTLIAAGELLAHAELALIDPELADAARRYLRAGSPRERGRVTTADERLALVTTWQSWREAIA